MIVSAPAADPPLHRAVRLLVAERAVTRVGIRIALENRARICAEAAGARDAIRAAAREQPDVCLVARALPGDGLTAVRGIRRAAPRAAVVVLADLCDADDMLDSLRAGAIGYVSAAVDAGSLRRIVDDVARGEAAVPRSMVRELILEFQANGSANDGLTGREAQVLGMLRRGHTTAQIAERLRIAPVTVRRHVSELVHKLGLEDRTALTDWLGR